MATQSLGNCFDDMDVNPPYGVEWKAAEDFGNYGVRHRFNGVASAQNSEFDTATAALSVKFEPGLLRDETVERGPLLPC